MSNTKISALAAMAVMAAPDEFVIVDKSDTTMATSGTTKRLPLSVMLADAVFLAALDTRYGATPWVAPTLVNGWVNFGSDYLGAAYQTARYRKVGDVVYIEGMIKSGTIDQPVFILPAGFRPAARQVFTCLCRGAEMSPSVGIGVGGVLYVTPGGTVIPHQGFNDNIAINCYFSVLP